MYKYINNIMRETSLDILSNLNDNEQQVLTKYFEKYLISKYDLKKFNTMIEDFKCNCRNEDICAECALKQLWKEMLK